MATNTPQRVQTGVQYVRIHRAPLDNFSELQDKVEQKGNCETKSGSFYAGLYTAVIDDDNASYNGPYYISYTKTGGIGTERISYTYDKIVRESDLEENIFSWGRIL